MLHTLNGKVSLISAGELMTDSTKPSPSMRKSFSMISCALRMGKAAAEGDLKVFMGKANARPEKFSRKRPGISAKAYGNSVRQGPQDGIEQEQPGIFKPVASR